MPIISYDIEQPLDVTETKHRKFLNKAHRVAMTTHRDVRMKKHFETNAETSPGGPYGYVQRSAKYVARKLKFRHHNKPNFFTGQTRRIALSAKVRATFKKATLSIRPNFQNRGEKVQSDKFVSNKRRERDTRFVSRRAVTGRENLKQRIAELEAITNGERHEIQVETLEVYAGELTQFRKGRKRIRIRG